MQNNLKNIIKLSLPKTNIQMIVIFILSGIFAKITNLTGCSANLVNLVTNNVPYELLTLGIFIATSVISTAIGTSFGSIIVIAPIALSLSQNLEQLNVIYIASAIISGAYFGDNISFISDTTIAAIQTQKAKLFGKFKENIKIATPLFIIMCLYYYNAKITTVNIKEIHIVDLIYIVPYFSIIVLGFCRINVLIALIIGILITATLAITKSLNITQISIDSLYLGFQSVSDLVYLTLLISIINGILEYFTIFEKIKKYLIKKEKLYYTIFQATLLCGLLLLITNLITANNTIAILLTGKVVYDIFTKTKTKDTSFQAMAIDNLSCGIHGLIPYAPQVLLVASSFQISPFEVISHSYYCMGLVVLTIAYGYLKSKKNN